MAEKPEQPVEGSKSAENARIEDLKLLMESFTSATSKLEESYELIQEEARKLREEVEEKNRRLSELSNMLEGILMNSRSSIIALDSEHEPIMMNSEAESMLERFTREDFIEMLRSVEGEGLYELQPEKGVWLKISSGALSAGELSGFVYVIDDISELKNMEVERQRDEKLKLMGEMAANIAHDIRNPLGSIELFASLLGRDLEGDSDKKRLTHSIIKGVRTINSIISNILLFTKEIQLDMKTVYVADIVDDVILYLQHLMRDKDVHFKNRIGEDDVITCDEELFKQVVMNILHNAVEAVSKGGEITMESSEEDGMTLLTVTDNGCGIDSDMAGKLFMPFQTTKAKGTGLGLAIVYKIVKAHGGNIEADSDGETYTAFRVTVPRTG
ncbi:sensor histidine kinase [Limisalsivibrio acetivorans]|uniref:sensor histidine kinase n=1 Tax=Limisalsivibrio acetivorans TaxID=1304888 RepID=UPI0003B4E204|nr:ATP-binding protein [Limisalsivibrio acetivorans]